MASRTQKRTWQRPAFPKQTTPIQRDRGQTWLTIARRYLGDEYSYRAWMEEATLVIRAWGAAGGSGQVRVTTDGIVVNHQTGRRIEL